MRETHFGPRPILVGKRPPAAPQHKTLRAIRLVAAEYGRIKDPEELRRESTKAERKPCR